MNRTSVCIAVSLFALLALSACVPSATIIHTVPSAELEERDEDEETAAKSQNTLLAEDAAVKKEHDDKMQAAKARAILIGKTALNDPKSGLSFLQIPSGTFMMGCTEGDKACDRGEKPTHSVTISRPFYMAFTLTTNFQYQKCVDAGVCHGKADMTKRANPIGNVNWIEAQEFCGWAGGRLPTEAEWEYAARGGTAGWRFPWGNEAGTGNANLADAAGRNIEYVGIEANPDVARVFGLTYPYQGSSPVGTFSPNGFGLDDMAGNVLQWTSDWKGDYTSGHSRIRPVRQRDRAMPCAAARGWSQAMVLAFQSVTPPHLTPRKTTSASDVRGT